MPGNFFDIPEGLNWEVEVTLSLRNIVHFLDPYLLRSQWAAIAGKKYLET